MVEYVALVISVVVFIWVVIQTMHISDSVKRIGKLESECHRLTRNIKNTRDSSYNRDDKLEFMILNPSKFKKGDKVVNEPKNLEGVVHNVHCTEKYDQRGSILRGFEWHVWINYCDGSSRMYTEEGVIELTKGDKK